MTGHLFFSFLISTTIFFGSNSGALVEVNAGGVGEEFPRPFTLVRESNRAIAHDAMRRWKEKNYGQRVDDFWTPIIMVFPDQRCVQLVFIEEAIGGSPIYCYELYEDKLIRKFDDVE